MAGHAHQRVGRTGAVSPAMSVVVVVGAQRGRAVRSFEALSRQTIARRLEVILVDTRPDAGALGVAADAPVEVIPGPSLSYGAARAAAVSAAQGEIVAFIEDHCYPRPEWAEAVLEAFSQPCAAVGYAITNANPQSRVSRVVHLATYGEWESPSGGGVTSRPGGNVAYRRKVLLGLADELPAMLQTDYNLHTWMLDHGLTMVVAPRARAEHVSPESILDSLRGCFVYSRVLAATRARSGGWGTWKRLVVGARKLVGAPVPRLVRLRRELPPSLHREMRLRRYLPGVLVLYFVSSAGEMVGCLRGEGRSLRRLLHWEVDTPRTQGG